MGKNDFAQIPDGHNGIEERLAILWEKLVFSERSTASKFVALSSANTAKIMNLWPQKGCIAEDSDADLVIWNPNTSRLTNIFDLQFDEFSQLFLFFFSFQNRHR